MLEALPVEQAAVGDVINLDIGQGRGSVVAFEVARDGAFLLSTSGQMDTECYLYNSAGNEMGYNDDFGDDQNCGIDPGDLARGQLSFRRLADMTAQVAGRPSWRLLYRNSDGVPGAG